MLIKIKEDEFIPADVVVMKSSDPGGGLFVETKNLDGETNLKNKVVAKPINDIYSSENTESLENLKCKVQCE